MKCPKCGSDKTSKVSVLAPEWKPGEHWCKACGYHNYWCNFCEDPKLARWAKPDETLEEYAIPDEDLAPPGELQCRRCAGGSDGEHRCLKK